MKIQKQELLTALETVKPGLASKEKIEQSTSFAFMGDRIVTYNDEISISHPVSGLDITGAIHADELYSLLGKIKQDEIDLTLEGNEIRMKAGRTKAGITMQDEVILPLDEIGNVGKWRILPDEFNHFLKFAIFSCSRDMSRAMLTGVHVRKDGIIESSDSYRITQCQLGDPMPINNFLIPAWSAAEVVKLKPIQVAKGTGFIHFRTDQDTIISSRIIAEPYMDTSKVMKMVGIDVSLPKSIGKAIDKAAVFAKRETFLDENVRVYLEENKIKLTSESEAGWFEETLNVKYTDEPFNFSITPGLFKDIIKENLDCVVGDDRIKFEGAGWVHIIQLRK